MATMKMRKQIMLVYALTSTCNMAKSWYKAFMGIMSIVFQNLSTSKLWAPHLMLVSVAYQLEPHIGMMFQHVFSILQNKKTRT